MAQHLEPFSRRDGGDGTAEVSTAAMQPSSATPSSADAPLGSFGSQLPPRTLPSPPPQQQQLNRHPPKTPAAETGPSGEAVPKLVTAIKAAPTPSTAPAPSDLERKMELLEARFVSPPPAASPAAKGGIAITTTGHFRTTSATPQQHQRRQPVPGHDSSPHDHRDCSPSDAARQSSGGSPEGGSRSSHHSSHSHSHHSFTFDAPSESSRDALLGNSDNKISLLPQQNAPLIQTKSYREANLAAERHMARIGRTLNIPPSGSTSGGAATGGNSSHADQGTGGDGSSSASSSSLGSSAPGDGSLLVGHPPSSSQQQLHMAEQHHPCSSNSVPASLSGSGHQRSCSSSNQTLLTGHHARGGGGTGVRGRIQSTGSGAAASTTGGFVAESPPMKEAAVKRLTMSEGATGEPTAAGLGGLQKSTSSSSGKRKSTPVKRALPSVSDASHNNNHNNNGGHNPSGSPTPRASGQPGNRKRSRLHFSASTSSGSANDSRHADGGTNLQPHAPQRQQQQPQQQHQQQSLVPSGLASPHRIHNVEPSSLSRERSNPGSSSRSQAKLKVPPPNNTCIRDFFGSVKKAGVTKSAARSSAGSGSSASDAPVATARGASQPSEGPSAAPSASEVSSPKPSSRSARAPAAASGPYSPPASSSSAAAAREIERLRHRCEDLERSLSDKAEQLKAVSNNQTMMQASLRASLVQREREVENLSAEMERRSEAASDTIERLVRAEAAREAAELRQRLASDGARLGRIVYTRAGMHTVESWEDGQAARALKRRRAELKERRDELELRQKTARKAAKKVASSAGAAGQAAGGKESPVSDVVGGVLVQDSLDAMEAEESVRLHLAMLKKEEEKLAEEERALFAEKGAHIRALKRVASEDSSRFKSRPKLHDRYIPLCQLGKGGFSEVWRAYDLMELKEVAVKIHQLDPRWSDAKKENYTKHVSREYEIHRDVRHPRIVSLYDVFEIDTNSFATVLECCEGTDLDALLKEKKTLPERDARAILLQILSGMRYLSTPSADGRRQGIIHYDLKPGNILFDKYGDAKITDFGLSKIVDGEDPADSMELTSQGAGTYWYLPPECFVMHQSVRISNKVDVWSIGVIYYQMLYGRRPFGDGQSQDKVLSNNTMLNAREVKFPAKPQVSDEAKDFVRQCLAYDQAFRPNISQLCTNPYLQQKKL